MTESDEARRQVPLAGVAGTKVSAIGLLVLAGALTHPSHPGLVRGLAAAGENR